MLQQHDVAFQPSINEDLGDGALPKLTITIRPVVNRVYSAIGTVKVMALIVVFRQANIQGTAKFGGVWSAGDDHNAESSVFAHHDHIFAATLMPLLFPALLRNMCDSVSSRCLGSADFWVGFKAVTEIIESAGSPQPTLPRFQNPDFAKTRTWIEL